MHWEHFLHIADIGVRGYGANKEEAFEQAALAMTAVITDPAAISPKRRLDVDCEAPDDELLFVDWLNAIIYEMAVRKMLFSRFHVQLTGLRLKGTIEGEKIDHAKHKPAVEVKGATYTALRVYQTKNIWIAQCVVDV